MYYIVIYTMETIMIANKILGYILQNKYNKGVSRIITTLFGNILFITNRTILLDDTK